jgi:hypothetical protein
LTSPLVRGLALAGLLELLFELSYTRLVGRLLFVLVLAEILTVKLRVALLLAGHLPFF